MQVEQRELINPKTFHAPAGAYVAQHVLGINDKEIFNSFNISLNPQVKVNKV